ncbi:hypothetical protein [Nocardia sp. NPDC051570]|uniref:hypothetical protein n=1 Tax=Nocardia sp. NPDC051570 TaxID=3364324 RepID=UPI00378A38CB
MISEMLCKDPPMGRRGPDPLPYRRIPVTLKLHRNVDALLDQLAGEEGVARSAYVTAVLAEKAGVTVDSLLVPDNDDQEVLRSA